jgi:cytochrome c2
MKIASIQINNTKVFRFFGVLTIAFFSTIFTSFAQDGEELFNTHCATCHKVLDNSTGPKLQGVRKKWADGGSTEASL